MMRKTTSRKLRNAATMSEAEMAGVPRPGALRAEDCAGLRSPRGIVYQQSSPRWSAGRRPGELPKHMPDAPILILLGPSAASPGTEAIPRGPDGDPIILGLSLFQRAALAARRAGYGQVLLLGAKGAPTPGAAAIANWRDLAATLSLSHGATLVIAPAAILAETDWLERRASTRIEPAAWGRIPHRIVMLAAASAPDTVDELDRDSGAQD